MGVAGSSAVLGALTQARDVLAGHEDEDNDAPRPGATVAVIVPPLPVSYHEYKVYDEKMEVEEDEDNEEDEEGQAAWPIRPASSSCQSSPATSSPPPPVVLEQITIERVVDRVWPQRLRIYQPECPHHPTRPLEGPADMYSEPEEDTVRPCDAQDADHTATGETELEFDNSIASAMQELEEGLLDLYWVRRDSSPSLPSPVRVVRRRL